MQDAYHDNIVIEINFQLYESKSVPLKTTVRIVIAVLWKRSLLLFTRPISYQGGV